MSFGAMAAWQAWLLVAAAAGAAAWLFHVKVRPPKVSVSSLLLWRRVLDQTRNLTWWERVRRAVSLAATMLIAVTLALAVTRPGPRVTASSAGRVLIVLDSSWSMSARTSGGATRWAHAVAEARLIAHAAGNGEVALATTADGLVEGPTSDLALIETALERLAPAGDESAGWPRVGHVGAVHFLTDGAIARPRDANVIVHSVYDPAPNVAITAFTVRSATMASGRAEAYLEYANYADAPQNVRLTVSRGTAIVVDNASMLASGEVVRQVVPLDLAGDPRLRARVTAPSNALEADDEAAAWMTSAEPIKVTVVSADAGALALLLQREPGVQATFVKPADYRPGDEDVVILDRWVPDAPPGRPALVVAPVAVPWLGTAGAEERAPRWTRAGSHPVLAGVDPLTLDVKRARSYSGPTLVPITVSDQGTPLVSISESADRRWVVLSFALGDSNLSQSPVFPVLVGNALEWLARPALSGTGRPGPLVVPASTTRVLGPEGRALRIMRAGDRAVVTLATPGFYRVETAGSHSVAAVNVGAPDVSNLLRTSLRDEERRASLGSLSGRPWWFYAVLVAFLLAAVEWWTWQRRITV